MTFSHRTTVQGDVRVDVAFTDSTLDLGAAAVSPDGIDAVARECGVGLALMRQVHGDDVVVVDTATPTHELPQGDALVTTRPGVGLVVRVADCVPLLLADVRAGVVAAVHAGRPGLALGVAVRAVERMRQEGAGTTPGSIAGWIGPHVCAACYEVPEAMRAEVAAVVPASYAVSREGTPALDIGAGVRSQLEAVGVEVVDVGGCTREDPRLHSYRRDGAAAGRFAGLVWMS